ncbi:MAG: hypothetical protein ACNS61_10515 [Candidatus Wenzhouxiangella sp. M2_3B_020]
MAMAERERNRGLVHRPGYWRVAGWSFLAFLLLVPLLAMQFTDEVAWTAADFVVMGVLLALVGLGFELAARLSGDFVYRAAFGVAVLGGFLLIWANLAVGVIGTEGNPANASYLAVLAVGVLGAVAARGHPRGMAATMFAAASVQVLIAVVAMVLGLGQPWSGPLEITVTNGFFVVLFLASAALFLIASGRRR